ncbi:unnamed protein product [Mytilus coruscus]|uniref:Uncharacterized protein n=1 Tax=Mytilus coruscus TaxID=42192 RepID=A0A6J8EIQ5_MYTCO|nr:unnamed protein product [Mytilus coruscus]
MSAYVLQHDIEDQQTGEAPSHPETTTENNVRNRGPWKKSGHSVEPPRDDAVYYPKDDTYGVFAQGRDYEPVYITHKYTEEEKKTLSSFESEDYLPSHSEIYKSWLKRQGPLGYMLGKWIIMGLIGFCVGIIGFLLHDLIEEIAKLKWNMVEKYLKVRNYTLLHDLIEEIAKLKWNMVEKYLKVRNYTLLHDLIEEIAKLKWNMVEKYLKVKNTLLHDLIEEIAKKWNMVEKYLKVRNYTLLHDLIEEIAKLKWNMVEKYLKVRNYTLLHDLIEEIAKLKWNMVEKNLSGTWWKKYLKVRNYTLLHDLIEEIAKLKWNMVEKISQGGIILYYMI